MEIDNIVQKKNPTTRFVSFIDDMVQNDTVAEAVKSYCGEGGTLEVQKDVAGNLDNEEKCIIYSPSGDLDCVPPFMVGSPHHRDEDGNLTGREACFKIVGTYLGDTEAASEAIGKRLAKNLRPLDFIDTLECTEGIQNVGHLKYNLITRQACPKTKYICSVTPPEISEGPARAAAHCSLPPLHI